MARDDPRGRGTRLKDITSTHQDHLDVASFVDELAKRMKFKNPMIRTLCLGWTMLLLNMENLDLEIFIPRFLEGIFVPGTSAGRSSWVMKEFPIRSDLPKLTVSKLWLAIYTHIYNIYIYISAYIYR